MKPQCREPSRRITPDLLDFYIKRGHELRDEAYREMWRGLWVLAMKVFGRQ